MRKLLLAACLALLFVSSNALASPSITSLLTGATTGGPDFTSAAFTPTTGDTVLVAIASQSNSLTVTVTTTGYTYTCKQFQNAIMCWAFSVPSGAKTFTTSGLTYNGTAYQVFDISGLNGTQDQYGTQVTPNTGTQAEVTTAGNLAVSNQVGIVALMNGATNSANTTLAGWTAFTQLAASVGAVYLAVAYNLTAGTSGSTLTGGWSAFSSSGGAAEIVTFEATGGAAPAAAGFIGPAQP